MEFIGEGPELGSNQFFLTVYDIIVSSFAFLFNLSLCILLLLKPKVLISKARHVYLLNLAIWDMSFAIYCIVRGSLRIHTQRIYTTYTECIIEGFVGEWVGLNSLTGLSLLAIDRYSIVVKQKTLTRLFQVLSFIIANTITLITAISPLFFGSEGIVLQPSGYYCLLDQTLKREQYQFIVMLPMIVFTLNLNVIFFSYIRILKEIQKAISPLQKMKTSQQGQSHSSHRSSVSKSITFSQTLHENPNEVFKMFKWFVSWIPKDDPSFAKRSSVTNTSTLGSTSSGTHRASRLSTTFKKNSRFYEMQIAKKTILIGACHMVLYLPFGFNTILQLCQVSSLSTLDTIDLCCIEICLCCDALWVLIFDKEMSERRKKYWVKIKKRISLIKVKFFSHRI